MLRALVKTGFAGALHLTRADKLIGILTGLQNMPLVICYHRVVEDFDPRTGCPIPSMLISRRTLERQLDWIGHRFRFISLEELGTQLESGGTFSEPVAAITFDDGYSDMYFNAFPLLKRKGIPAAVFPLTHLIGTTRVPVYDKLYLLLALAFSAWRNAARDLAGLLRSLGIQLPEIQRMGTSVQTPSLAMRTLLNALPQAQLYRVIEALEDEFKIEEGELKRLHALTWEMLSEMHAAGVTIGSHTKTHALLTHESPEVVREEIAGSRQELEKRLGTTIHHFAYPNGWFNPATVSSVADAGYRFAYTTCLHCDPNYPLLTIPRKPLWENSCLDALGRFSPSIMSCQAHRVFDVLNGCHQNHN
jgi:peptidoglycan/xylan/chitin deacetylase (PgdA/CDA1 family)